MSGDKKVPQDGINDEAEDIQDKDGVTEENTETSPSEDLASEDADEVDQETPGSDDDQPEDVEVEDADPVSEPILEPEATSPAPVTQVVKKGGFAPMVLGGVVCLALGYAGAQFVKPSGWPFPGSNTNELQQEIEALNAQIADLKSASTASAASQTAAVEVLRGEFETKLAALDEAPKFNEIDDKLSGFEDRLTEIEARPVAEAIVSPEATAAYERQLAQMQDLLNSEIVRLEEAKDKAVAEETAARVSTAKARLQALVDAGEPFAQVLDDLGGNVPAALKQAAQSGIPSVTALQEGYSDAARTALISASRAAYEAGEQNWFQTVLHTQIGLRSTKPKEGDDADAILSRAEQSVRDGLFAKAISTLDALPEAGKAAMQEWIAQAQKRMDVMTALDEFLGQ